MAANLPTQDGSARPESQFAGRGGILPAQMANSDPTASTTPGDLVFWNGDPSQIAGLTSAAADGSSMKLSAEPGPGRVALRLDFELSGPTSWAIARFPCRAELPPHYVVVLRLRGDAPPSQLQFKLVDPAGANVWWWRHSGFTFRRDSEVVTLRKAALEFAWGPASGGEPHRLGAVEIALAAGAGGAGTVWIEELRIEAREPETAIAKVASVSASSETAGHEARCMLADEIDSDWRPREDDEIPWLALDLSRSCEWGGVVLDFAAPAPVGDCRLLSSEDGDSWKLVARTNLTGASRCWLRTTIAEGRFAKVEFDRGLSPIVTRAGIVALEHAVSPARYASAEAARHPRGLYPRHLLGQQAYWAVVGADGDERKGLLSEDGALEVGAESFSIEPFLCIDGKLRSWADGERLLELADGHLPIPTVQWEVDGLRLRITAFASGLPGSSTLVARYEVKDLAGSARSVKLFLAIRPFQVNPAWQSLNLVGAVAPIELLERSGSVVKVGPCNVGQCEVRSVSAPDAFSVFATEEGLAPLLQGHLSSRQRIDDPLGFAHGVLSYDLEIAARSSTCIVVAVALHESSDSAPMNLDRVGAADWANVRLSEATTHWRRRLANLPIELPDCARDFTDTLKASLGWILVNREGPRIQPGPRCYRRSWIRDGTLTGTALAEMGFVDEARDFLRWYAPHQLENGRVPCAVDRHGIDPVAEHDSHGQLIWGIVEVWRLSGDLAFLRELWPHARRAADAIEALRAERTTERYAGKACYGLMPESISHEGYSSRPVHAFWDDFFAVRGLADAADAAAVVGEASLAVHYGELRDVMRHDLHVSIARTITDHGIDFLPGSVELGDLDPTSTAIALDPGGEGARLPQAELARTFELFWGEFEQRRRGETTAEAYTAYEVRNAPALVLLGLKHKAIELLQWLIDDQRPAPWRQWPEVSTRDPRAPRFLGDLPHGWIASSFVRSLRRMLAYERADDGALVLAAGVAAAWVEQAPGVTVRGLATHAGTLDFTMQSTGSDTVRVTIGGALRWPSAGVVVESPLPRPLLHVVVDGRREAASDPARVVLRLAATEVILEYGLP